MKAQINTMSTHVSQSKTTEFAIELIHTATAGIELLTKQLIASSFMENLQLLGNLVHAHAVCARLFSSPH